jgi:hypothetical protein
MRASTSWITMSALIVSTAACAPGDRSTTAALEPPGARSSEMDWAVGSRSSAPPHLPNVEVGPDFGDRPDNGGGGPGE